MMEDKELREKLWNYRAETKATTIDLIKKCGIAPATLYKFINGGEITEYSKRKIIAGLKLE